MTHFDKTHNFKEIGTTLAKIACHTIKNLSKNYVILNMRIKQVFFSKKMVIVRFYYPKS